MQLFIALGVILLYIFVGFVVMYAIDKNPSGGDIAIMAIGWPVALLMFLIFGFFTLAVKIGSWINEKIDKL